MPVWTRWLAAAAMCSSVAVLLTRMQRIKPASLSHSAASRKAQEVAQLLSNCRKVAASLVSRHLNCLQAAATLRPTLGFKLTVTRAPDEEMPAAGCKKVHLIRHGQGKLPRCLPA